MINKELHVNKNKFINYKVGSVLIYYFFNHRRKIRKSFSTENRNRSSPFKESIAGDLDNKILSRQFITLESP